MSFSGQHRIRLLLFLFSILLIFSLVSGFKASLTPYEINLTSDAGKDKCAYFYLNLDKNVNITLEYRWAQMGEFTRNLEDYYFDSNFYGIFEKSNIQTFKNTSNITVCFNSLNSGQYFGLILFKPNNISFGLGSWINFKVIGNFQEPTQFSFSSLTGKVIDSTMNLSKNNFVLILGLLPSLVLFFILILLIKKEKSIKNNIN
jgi:hypothetical protein